MRKREINEVLNSVRLTHREKSHMKSELFFRANINGYHRRRIRSPFMFVIPTMPVAFVAILLFVISGFARTALPGDNLYAFKRGVNERVLGAFAVSPEKKAKLETELIARRFEEIEKVIDQAEKEDNNTDSSETSIIIATLQEEITDSHAKVQEYIDEVSTEGKKTEAIEISTALIQTVEIHSSIIESSVEEGTSLAQDVLEVVEQVAVAQEEVVAQTEAIVLEVIVSDGEQSTVENQEESAKMWQDAILKLEEEIGAVDSELAAKGANLDAEFVAQSSSLLQEAKNQLSVCRTGELEVKQTEERIQAFLACTNGLSNAKTAHLILTETAEIKKEKVEKTVEIVQEKIDNAKEIGDTILPPLEEVVSPDTTTEVEVENEVKTEIIMVPTVDPVTGETIMVPTEVVVQVEGEASTGQVEAAAGVETTASTTLPATEDTARQSLIQSIFSR